MKLRPLEPMRSRFRTYISASTLLPLALLIDVSANFSVYIARSGLCAGENLNAISHVQTLGAGALPPTIPYVFAPRANIMTVGLDLDSHSLVRSIFWVFTLTIFVRSILSKRFVAASFSATVLFLTLTYSNIENNYSCDLTFAHKNVEANFQNISRPEIIEKIPTEAVSQTILSESVIELSGAWGEPTCSVYVLTTPVALAHDREIQPSWQKASKMLKERNVPYEDALKIVSSRQDKSNTMYYSFKAFSFVNGQRNLKLYSLLACDPARMPAI